jgi:hypothetical protein
LGILSKKEKRSIHITFVYFTFWEEPGSKEEKRWIELSNLTRNIYEHYSVEWEPDLSNIEEERCGQKKTNGALDDFFPELKL